MGGEEWFVKSYVLLYLLAPVLNLFAEQSDRATFRAVLLGYFIYAFTYGWVGAVNGFDCGYSTLHFIGLYLLARYVHLYRPRFALLSARQDFGIYIAITAAASALYMVATLMNIPIPGFFLRYNAPTVVLASLYLVLCFSKLSFTNVWVNKVAASCFAVYLFHCNFAFLDPVYKRTVLNLYADYSLWPFLALTLLWVAVVFMVSILLDKVRILVWRPFDRKLFKRS